MPEEKDKKTGVANPKQGAGSGVNRPASTDGDTGPKTTTATPKGKSTVDNNDRSRQ